MRTSGYRSRNIAASSSRPRKPCGAAGADAQLACASISFFHESAQFVPQAQNARSVFVDDIAHGRGPVALGARGAVEHRAGEFRFEFSDRKTHRGLRAMNAHGRLSDTAFFHHCHEHFELHQFHECLRKIAPALADALKNTLKTKEPLSLFSGITARVLQWIWSRPLSALGRRNSPKDYQDYGQNLDCYE